MINSSSNISIFNKTFTELIPKTKEDLFFIGSIFFFLFVFIDANPYAYSIDDYDVMHQLNDYANLGYNQHVSEGRWGVYLMGLLMNTLGANTLISSNYFFSILFKLQFAYSAWLLLKFLGLNVNHKWLIIPFILAGVHPFLAEVQTFKSFHSQMIMGFYLPMSIISVQLVFKKERLINIIGILLIIYCLSIYQATVNIIFILILLKGLQLLYLQKNNVIQQLILPVIFTAIGVVIYFILNKLLLSFLELSLPNRGGFIQPLEFLKRIIRLLLVNPIDFLKMLAFNSSIGLFALWINTKWVQSNLWKEIAAKKMAFWGCALIGILLLAFIQTWFYLFGKFILNLGEIESAISRILFLFGVTSFYVIILLQQIKSETYLKNSLLSLFLIIGAYLSTVGITLFLQDMYLVPRVFMGIGIFIGISYACYFSHIQKYRPLKIMTIAMMSIMAFSYTLSTNTIFFDSERINQLDRNKANRIISDIEKIPAFKDKRILVYTNWTGYDQQIYTKAGDLNESALNRPWSRLRVIEYVGGYDFKEPTKEDMDLAKQKLAMTPSKWPDRKSILVEKDLIIIFI